MVYMCRELRNQRELVRIRLNYKPDQKLYTHNAEWIDVIHFQFVDRAALLATTTAGAKDALHTSGS